MNPINTYAEAKRYRDAFEADCTRISATLKAFPRLPNGLTPDAVKTSPEYRSLKLEFERAFNGLRQANVMILRRFSQESRAERRASHVNIEARLISEAMSAIDPEGFRAAQVTVRRNMAKLLPP